MNRTHVGEEKLMVRFVDWKEVSTIGSNVPMATVALCEAFNFRRVDFSSLRVFLIHYTDNSHYSLLSERCSPHLRTLHIITLYNILVNRSAF